MEPDYTLLTTWAECDKATADTTFKLKTFTARDYNLEVADDRADRSQEAGAAALAKKDSEIAAAQHDAAQPNLTAQAKQDADDIVELLQSQRKKILRDNRAGPGPARFGVTVSAAQTEAQIALLQQVLTGIATRRAELRA